MAAASEIVQSVASEKSLFDYFVSGTTLGRMTGEQLRATAESEATKAEGHQFNATLCSTLAEIVPEGKTVRECVKETGLKTIFGGIYETGKGGVTSRETDRATCRHETWAWRISRETDRPGCQARIPGRMDVKPRKGVGPQTTRRTTE